MTITIGFWETLGGEKAEVVDVRGNDAIGWIGKYPHRWLTHGGSEPTSATGVDNIVRPWIDKPVFNHWDKIPGAKAVYLTYDKRWVACSHVPKWHESGTTYIMSFWTLAEPTAYCWSVGILNDHRPVWGGDPKDSRIIRPEGV